VVLVLGRRDVESLLDLPTAVAVTEALFREQAAGDLAPDPPHRIRLQRGAMRLVAGALLGSRRGGVRVSAGAGGGDPAALVYDLDAGTLLCIQAYPFSSLRIGATVGLAAKLLAPARVRTVGMIGTGRNARSMLEGVCWARPEIEQVRVYSRREANRRQFADAMRAALGRDVTAVDEGRAVVEGVEVVLAATDPQEPVLYGDWLRPGQLIIGIGRPNEFDASVYRRADLVVVTQRHHEENYYDRDLPQPLLDLVARGEVTWVELGEIVAGRVALPPAETSLVVVRESQGGVGDVALASWVYTRARELGLGHEISLA
jgi:ornithine cyclodeaminase/alanine dehydrogenase-like protein (mu-crystallin family)